MKTRNSQDREIRGKIAEALRNALKQRKVAPEVAARLLHVRLGTLYKYLAGTMIPGGQVLWRACNELDMVLDDGGFRPLRHRSMPKAQRLSEDGQQPSLPFMNETVENDKIKVNVRKKDSEHVRVTLKIKVAG